ncbi:MAG: alpha amylase family protein [Bacteroidales bacterium]
MKRLLLLIALFAFTLINGQEKPKYIWFDCEANYEILGSEDSIDFYLNKVKSIGITHVVVDVKSIMGEVLYKSKIAPFMGEWEGAYRSENFDMLGIMIEKGHKMGLKVFASLNVFAGGHNFFNRGIIYKQHPEWQSQVYWQGKIMPISEMKWNYNGMLNPANPKVRKYELEVLKEFAMNYKKLDGIILDRMRFDNITSDFSPQSKEQFESYSGIKLEKYPEDILYWQNVNDKMEWKPGKHFNKWIEWRAMIIKSFVSDVHKELKKINRRLIIGDYTGAWYPTYYQLGVNWASEKYDPSKEFTWATPQYRNSGYAELLDVYMTGLYYTNITKEDVDRSTGMVGKRREAAMDNSRSYWYSVEGGAELAKEITCGVVPVIGSILVTQYEGDEKQFKRAVSQVLQSSEGVMIFDISHIIKNNWWNQLEEVLR